MRCFSVLGLLLCGISVGGWPSAAAADAASSSRSGGEEQVTILIAPRTWFLFLEEPDRYFQNAFSDCKEGRPKEAARNIQRAATLLKIEAAGASKQQREPLESAIFGLELLADEVAADRVKTADVLAQAFARAHCRMAQFHEQQANMELARDDYFAAGQELQAASHHLDHGFRWAGAMGSQELATLVQGASSVAGQLLAGADATAAGPARDAVRDLGVAVQTLARMIREPGTAKP